MPTERKTNRFYLEFQRTPRGEWWRSRVFPRGFETREDAQEEIDRRTARGSRIVYRVREKVCDAQN